MVNCFKTGELMKKQYNDREEYIKYEEARRILCSRDYKIGLTAMKMKIIFDNIKSKNDVIAYCRGDAIVIDREQNSILLNSLEKKVYIICHEVLHRILHTNSDSSKRNTEFIRKKLAEDQFYPSLFHICCELEVDLIIRKKNIEILWSYPFRDSWLKGKKDLTAIEIYEDILKNKNEYLSLMYNNRHEIPD